MELFKDKVKLIFMIIIYVLLAIVLPIACFIVYMDSVALRIAFIAFLVLSALLNHNKMWHILKGNPLFTPGLFAVAFLFARNFDTALNITVGYCLSSLLPQSLCLIAVHGISLIAFRNPIGFIDKNVLLDPKNEKALKALWFLLPTMYKECLLNEE